jgi:ketosteroid isomerase-like protein
VSQENVDLIRRMYEASVTGGQDAALAYCHPEVEWIDLMHAPDEPERKIGLVAVREAFEQWDQAFDTVESQIDEHIDAGDSVVTLSRWRARGKSSGVSTTLQGAEVYECENGKVVRVTQGFPDRESALKAVGLSE